MEKKSIIDCVIDRNLIKEVIKGSQCKSFKL